MEDIIYPRRTWQQILLLAEAPKYDLCIKKHDSYEKKIADEFPVIHELLIRGYIKYITFYKDIPSNKKVYCYTLTELGITVRSKLK